LVHESPSSSVLLAVVFGVVFGVASRVDSIEQIIAALVGTASFLTWSYDILANEALTDFDRKLLFGAAIAAIAFSCFAVMILLGRVLWVPIIVMTVVELVTLGTDLQATGLQAPQPIDVRREALIMFAVAALASVLAGWMPKLVLPLVGLGLLVVHVAVALGTLTAVEISAVSFAALVSFALARSLARTETSAPF
jgi:hypothetical protein